MRRTQKTILALLLALPLVVVAQGVYRWVDKDGKVHYGDSPPPENKSVQQKNLKAGTSTVTDNLPFAVRDAVQKNPVTVYLTKCGELCDGARALLAKRGVPYTVKDPDNNPADTESLNKLAGGLEVPFLQIGDTTIRGFTEGGWNSALDAAGYPRVNPFSTPPEPKKSEMPKDKVFKTPGKESDAKAPPPKGSDAAPAK